MYLLFELFLFECHDSSYIAGIAFHDVHVTKKSILGEEFTIKNQYHITLN